MASLKAQVEEIKSMLKVSFDLQLDIQRAIRQEVAAAMSEKSGESEAHYNFVIILSFSRF